jgi:predicted component of type VI protein secretion system
MRNYFSGREARAVNGKREESKVGLVTRFYTGDRTNWRHVITSKQIETKRPYQVLLAAYFAVSACRAHKCALRIQGF